MKKISIIGSIIILFTIFACIALSSGGNANTLYLLNWGEYINQELITKFEQEYNAIVIEETVTSSETMYQKIMAGTTSYDVVIIWLQSFIRKDFLRKLMLIIKSLKILIIIKQCLMMTLPS